MYIAPIKNFSLNNYKTRTKVKPTFCAHPDFYKYNSTQSCFFRRGAVVLPCNKGYADIENLFKSIFQKNTIQRLMLIIGVAASQEPFSYLASIKGIIKNRPLKNNVDLFTVDLRSKPKRKELKKQAFCDLRDYERFPKYAEKGFVQDTRDSWLEVKRKPEQNIVKETMLYLMEMNKPKEQKLFRYRVHDEVFNLVNESYNNPEKSKWDNPVQEVITEYPDNKFDIISANNVLPYILSEEKIVQTIKHINRILKPEGYFITDPYGYPQRMEDMGVLNKFKEIRAGIYQKTL